MFEPGEISTVDENLEQAYAQDIAQAEHLSDEAAAQRYQKIIALREELDSDLYRIYLEDLVNSNSPLNNADEYTPRKRPAAEENAEYGAPEARTQPNSPKVRRREISPAEAVAKFYENNRRSDSDDHRNNKENNMSGRPDSPRKG